MSVYIHKAVVSPELPTFPFIGYTETSGETGVVIFLSESTFVPLHVVSGSTWKIGTLESFAHQSHFGFYKPFTGDIRIKVKDGKF